jgi:hypothetical protein
MRPVVDTSPPRTRVPIINNREKVLREMKIERENRLLQERIDGIMKRKRSISPTPKPFISPRNQQVSDKRIWSENALLADRILNVRPKVLTKKEAD